MSLRDGTDGLMFADAQGEVAPLSASFLYATGANNYLARLDQLQREGIEAVRWFGSPLTPSSTRRGCTRAEAESFGPVLAQMLLDRQMLGDFCGLCDTADRNLWPGGMNDFRAHTRWLGDLARAYRNLASCTLVNELKHSSQHDFTINELEQLAAEFGPVPCSLSAGADVRSDELDSNGEYWPANVDGCDSVDTHLQRGPEPAWDNANHGFVELRLIARDYHRARRSAEPQRCEDGVLPVGVFPYLLGVLGQGHITWSTLHSGALRDVNRGELVGQDLDDLRSFVRGGHALPRGRYHYENANNTGSWPNSPVRSAAFVEGAATTNDKTVWRAQSFQHQGDGQWFLVLYGPNADNPHIEMQNGFAPPDERDLIDRQGQYVKVYRIYQR